MNVVPDLGFIFTRPQLAYSDTLPFHMYQQHLQVGPLLGSVKLDGIRGIQKQREMVSRTLKRFRSSYVHTIAREEFEHFDGEFVIKPREIMEGDTVYHLTYSAVMTQNSMEPVDWWVFDYAMMHSTLDVYLRRYERLGQLVAGAGHPDVKLLEQRVLERIEDIEAMEQEALDLGYEGLIIRRPDSPYHCNRSSFKQGYLMKIVRHLSSECMVEDIYEMEHNMNVATIDARGFTKRSSHQANKVGKGIMGGFWVRDIHGLFGGNPWKLGLGDGWDMAFREDVWKNWPRDKGRIQTYTYKPYGTKDLPRQPVGHGWRDLIDIGVPNPNG